MSKAYDRVEWCFLERLMLKLGFTAHWVTLIMECVRTAQFSVLLNGKPTGRIIPTRGLRQGDPISPYLFLLVSEVLSSLITGAVSRRTMSGFRPGKFCPEISHLFFADDSLIFCRASIEQVWALKSILSQYEQASGQKINVEKSALFFSPNVHIEFKTVISGLLKNASGG